ncbi:MAG TPA: restriction endonuclease subunit S [Marinilabiliaceae bacterium]|nr:restriction endonuclease subunit S [Marinilabiliaceae bacterium]
MEHLTTYRYKQTEVGIIPKDWEIRNLTYLVDYFHGKAHESFISEHGKYIVVNSKYISTEGNTVKHSKENFCPAKKGDVLTVLSDIPNGKALAKCYLVNDDNKYAVNQRICIWRPKNIDANFLFYKLNRYKYFLALNDGVNQTNIGNSDIENCIVDVPPTLKEQKAIAQVLSDTDALIQALEKKIAKKKLIKKGVMQRLLTPKEGWVSTSLIELADYKKNQFDDGDWVESEHIISEGIRLIQTGNIGIGNFQDKGSKKYISEDSFNQLNCKEVLIGDLLICRLAEPAGRACIMPNIGENKVITSVDVSIFRGDSSEVNREFLSQLFTTNRWFQKVMEMVGGTTHKRISRRALGKIEISVPTVEEQNQIAQILTDMDKEIELLEQKLSKYQLAKQGMMQQLLTGKIRLV